ncbi:ATP synthase F0 subunit B [bacterium]|mgnify:CR=1 FL=1|nr:ATP synthase F0 subunit B [bacterium]|tara:strand:- start:45663 stop:46112 length:450 start_codon:yes stop_codon:yes gene_type:complete
MEEIVKVFGLNWKLLIVQAVNFGVLLLALWYFLYRPVLKMLDTRREKIEEGVKSAEKSQERLREIEGERDTVLKEATKSAEELLASSKERAQEQASQIVNDANTRADSILVSAEQRAQEAKEQALRESKAEIGKAAVLAAERILKEKQS